VETGNNKITSEHQLVDEAFNLESASSQYLSIQLSLNGLSFSIRDSEKFYLLKDFSFEKIFSWNQAADEAEKILKSENIAGKKFSSVTATVNHTKFSLVPSPLFDISKQKEYLKLNTEVDTSDTIYNNLIKSIDARNIFAMPLPVEKIFRRNFGACQMSHHLSILAESFLSLFKNAPEQKLLVNIDRATFDIILIKENKLYFCNSFGFHSINDIAYFLLFTCEQLKVNPEKISISLSGMVEKGGELHTLLEKYIRNIGFITRSQDYKYSYKFDMLPKHYFFGLLSR
jgi:hypothetical protein